MTRGAFPARGKAETVTPAGNAPTSEWSTILMPITVRLILEVLRFYGTWQRYLQIHGCVHGSYFSQGLKRLNHKISNKYGTPIRTEILLSSDFPVEGCYARCLANIVTSLNGFVTSSVKQCCDHLPWLFLACNRAWCRSSRCIETNVLFRFWRGKHLSQYILYFH